MTIVSGAHRHFDVGSRLLCRTTCDTAAVSELIVPSRPSAPPALLSPADVNLPAVAELDGFLGRCEVAFVTPWINVCDLEQCPKSLVFDPKPEASMRAGRS
jgi:hypothetical protein